MAADGKAPPAGPKAISIRLDPVLHQRVRRVAFERDESIQGIVEAYLVRYVEHHEGKEGKR